MILLEYEAKSLLAGSGVPVPQSVLIRPGEPILGDVPIPCVLKSQVPVGGRGKAGGVVVINDREALNEAIERLSLLEIKGHLPSSLLVEPLLDITHEYYLSLLVDRESGTIQLMINAEGGMEVESRDDFYKSEISPETIDTVAEQASEVFTDIHTSELKDLLRTLYDSFVVNDMTLLEINPLAHLADGSLTCADAKIELDDAARFRHPDWKFEDTPGDVNFVTLDPAGEIATIANGAGLAMATVDAVATAGMKPANFLDVGGGANKESVLRAFNRIMEYQHIKAIVINIFAGITRCDEVARAIIAAREEIDTLPPLFIRLAGTNFEEAAQLLKEKDIATLATLEACLEAASEQISKGEVPS